jgi:hypothetical protein
MHMFVVGLLAATALSGPGVSEPREEAMRDAFATDLADGVRAALVYVTEMGGPEALDRIRQARTDEFEIRGFRKIACRPDHDASGHLCAFVVNVDTIAGPIERAMAGRFLVGPCGLTYEEMEDAEPMAEEP